MHHDRHAFFQRLVEKTCDFLRGNQLCGMKERWAAAPAFGTSCTSLCRAGCVDCLLRAHSTGTVPQQEELIIQTDPAPCWLPREMRHSPPRRAVCIPITVHQSNPREPTIDADHKALG